MKRRKKRSNEGGQPAITIYIQSWATPIVGIVMLVLGLFGGYYTQPKNETTPNELAAVTEDVPSAPTGNVADNATVETNDLESKLRHVKGDPNAPILLVEFGDFQ